MIKFYATLFLSAFFLNSYSQLCAGCVSLVGDVSHGYEQLLLDTKGTDNADTTQKEIAATAWTCNSLGFPTCNSRGLFKFSLDAIPANATIVSAKLLLFAKPDNINGQPGNPMFGTANTSLLQKVVTDWTVSNTGWNNQPSTISRDQKTLPQSTSNRQDYSMDVADFVQYWVNKPDSNFGMLLKLQNEQYYNSMIFYSGNAPTDSLKPRLVVCYSLPSAYNLVIKGDTTGNAFKQILIGTLGPISSDTTQPEIAASAWTCNSYGVPECNTRGLFKYNLQQLPADAIVNSAYLVLSAKTNNINGQLGNPMFGNNNTSLLQRVVTDWTVANTGWNNQPAVTIVSQKTLPQSTSTVQNYKIDITDFVQFWANKPDSNFGMVLRLQAEQYYNSMIFHSGRAPADSLKPRLEICYSANQILPLGVTSFLITAGQQSNMLQWTVSNKENLSGIEIERSLNGTTFNVINTLNAGSGFSSNTFSASDNNIFDLDKVYYRLRLVKKDGTAFYSKILLVSNVGTSNFEVFPNPVYDYAYIKIKVPQDTKAFIKVKSIDGRTVAGQNADLKKGFNVVSLANLSKLSRGVYIFSVNLKGEVLNKKIILR